MSKSLQMPAEENPKSKDRVKWPVQSAYLHEASDMCAGFCAAKFGMFEQNLAHHNSMLHLIAYGYQNGK